MRPETMIAFAFLCVIIGVVGYFFWSNRQSRGNQAESDFSYNMLAETSLKAFGALVPQTYYVVRLNVDMGKIHACMAGHPFPVKAFDTVQQAFDYSVQNSNDPEQEVYCFVYNAKAQCLFVLQQGKELWGDSLDPHKDYEDIERDVALK